MTDSSLEVATISSTEKFQYIPLFGILDGRCTCGKSDCTRAGKHPRQSQWQSKASSDPRQIKKWQGIWSVMNLGIITGKASGIFVTDIDGEAGLATWEALQEQFCSAPKTREVITGRGRHLYWRYPDDCEVNCSVGKLGIGLDVRGNGGHVVAPPSLHHSGKHYEWVDESAECAEAPEWLLRLLTAPAEEAPIDANQSIPEGMRDDWMFNKVVAPAFRSGMTRDEVLKLALDNNAHRCSPPLPEAQIRDMVKRVEKSNRPVADISKRRSLAWMKFDAAEFLANQSIRSLTDAQVGWRTRLNAVAWLNGGKLEHDITSLLDYAKPSSKKTFREQWRLALFDYVEVTKGDDHFLINREMAAHHAEKVQKSIENQHNGHKGGTANSQGRRAA